MTNLVIATIIANLIQAATLLDLLKDKTENEAHLERIIARAIETAFRIKAPLKDK